MTLKASIHEGFRGFAGTTNETVPADRDLTRLWAQCRSCCDQTVHWARAGQTEIGGLDQMVIGVNKDRTMSKNSKYFAPPFTTSMYLDVFISSFKIYIIHVDDDLIRRADYGLTSECPTNGLGAFRSDLPTQAGQLSVGENRLTYRSE
jgi:hypothetical protein